MAPALFGTDGLRGTANGELTPELALAVGRAAARVLATGTFVVGRDTRRSGTMLQAAFCAGLASEGVEVHDVGVLPTPGVAMIAAGRGAAGTVISASHNGYGDNGIKLFGRGGTKLPTTLEERIEAAAAAAVGGRLADRPMDGAVGRIAPDPAAAAHYRDHLRHSLGGRRLDGLHVVVDCAHGAASAVAPEVFAGLGAIVQTRAAEPDGTNINDRCGSTCPEGLAREVVAHGAQLGVAFDGDADRMVAVDHTGSVADGDQLLALFALDLAERGRLPGNTVVVTVMTNLGFRIAMADRGITVRETPVGDRHVLAALDAEGLALGGEQSGHIVFRDQATTGDGILTGLALADLVVRSGRPLADLTSGLLQRVPQVLVNVKVADPGRLAGATEVWSRVDEISRELGGRGRVVVRPSGTEPVVRIMVEAVTEDLATQAVERLRVAVEDALLERSQG